MMTRRHFRAIAGAIREAWQEEVDPLDCNDGFAIAMDAVVERLYRCLHQQNPKFNKDIFKEACRK